MQRQVSTPLQLHELNLVSKQKPIDKTLSNNNQNSNLNILPSTNESAENITTPTKKIAPRLSKPVISPRKIHVDSNDDLLYKLASKKREINETELYLQQLKDELKSLELQFKNSKIVNNNNNNDKSNINDIVVAERQANEENFTGEKNTGDLRGPSNIRRAINTTNINNNINNTTSKITNSRFFKSIVDKFNDFNVSEDEFDQRVKTTNDNEFYIREGYDMGEDEIEREAQDEIKFLQRMNATKDKSNNSNARPGSSQGQSQSSRF